MAVLTEEQSQRAVEAMQEYFNAPAGPDGKTRTQHYLEFDASRANVIDNQLRPLLSEYLAGKVALAEFKSSVDSINKRHAYWGFRGFKGQMFFNVAVNVAGNQSQFDAELKAALTCPANDDVARGRIKAFASYVRRLGEEHGEAGGSKQGRPSVSSVPFFVSYFWHVHERNVWPIYYTNSVDVMTDLNLWQPSGDLSEDYIKFKHIHEELMKLFSLTGGRQFGLYDVEHVFLFKGRGLRKPNGDTKGVGEDTELAPSRARRSLEAQNRPLALGTRMPIFHKLEEPEKMELGEIVKLSQDGQVGIPLFQREFVWARQDVSDLFESILRGYYVGSLLFWSVHGDPDLKIEPVYGTGIAEDKLKPHYLVLDGQQRISSIYYATAAPNQPLWNTKRPYVFFIDLRRLLESDASNEPTPLVISLPRTDAEKWGLMKWPAQFQKWYFPIFEFKNFNEWLDDFDEHLKSRPDVPQDKAPEIKKRLRQFLRQVWERFEIPIIKLPEGMQLVDVAKIFEKLNSTGVTLTVFDLLNARMIKHRIELREMWDSAKDTFPLLRQFSEGNEKFPVYVLQTIALLRDRPSKSEELLRLAPENFLSDWGRACQAIDRALRRTTNLRKDGYGVLSGKWLPYMTMLPVLASLLERLEKREDKPVSIAKINSWYWSSIISHAYSGSTDTQIALDFRQLLEWFDDNGKVPETVQEARREMKTLNLGQVDRMSDAIYKGVMCLIALKGGRDIRKVDIIEFSTLDDHHIFPKSKASEFNAGNKINSIANKTLVDRATNEKYIRDSRPSQYLQKIMEEQDIPEDQMRERLETHLINHSAFEALMADDFGAFVSLRQKAIEEELGRLISEP